MALTPNSYLSNSTNVNLKDYQHAARLFVDDQFRLLPKNKFLFHVSFSINEAALKSIDLVQRHRNEINMLVKSVDLPNYTIESTTLNQYNRKKNVVTGHKFIPANIKFHDDNMGLINQLWQNYYSYYFADSTSAKNAGAYNRTATRNYDYIKTPYGLDNGSTLPFFNSITIYQMARHEYVSYTLHNPIITAWNHNPLDYTNQAGHDNNATIAYEAVSYGQGQVAVGDPPGFGVEHYDTTPSPLYSAGGLTSASPSFAASENVQGNAQEFLNNLTSTINGYQNSQNIGPAGSGPSVSSIAQTVQQGVSGVQGIAFPVINTVSNTITATKVFLGL
jgi:hypothetical protein